jgi:pathogenesis-related protein 1
MSLWLFAALLSVSLAAITFRMPFECGKKVKVTQDGGGVREKNKNKNKKKKKKKTSLTRTSLSLSLLQCGWNGCTVCGTPGNHNKNGGGAIDFGVALNTPILAAADGVVKLIGIPSPPGSACYAGSLDCCTGSKSNYVVVDHGSDTTSLYLHINQAKVTVGQRVRMGDVLALSGSTGCSTGPHLHFQVQANCASYWCLTRPTAFLEGGVFTFCKTYTSQNCPAAVANTPAPAPTTLPPLPAPTTAPGFCAGRFGIWCRDAATLINCDSADKATTPCPGRCLSKPPGFPDECEAVAAATTLAPLTAAPTTAATAPIPPTPCTASTATRVISGMCTTQDACVGSEVAWIPDMYRGSKLAAGCEALAERRCCIKDTVAQATPAPGGSATLTVSEAALLDFHNRERACYGLGALGWDDALEQSARLYAAQCTFSHSVPGTRGGANVGENLAAGSGVQWDAVTIANVWLDEEYAWTCASNTCAADRQCGHNTQLIAAAARRVGCASIVCHSNSPFQEKDWLNLVCHYDNAPDAASHPSGGSANCGSCARAASAESWVPATLSADVCVPSSLDADDVENTLCVCPQTGGDPCNPALMHGCEQPSRTCADGTILLLSPPNCDRACATDDSTSPAAAVAPHVAAALLISALCLF